MGEPPIDLPPAQMVTFWQDLTQRLTSRKLWVAVGASIAAYTLASQDGKISVEEIWQIIIPLLGYLGLEGAADVTRAKYQ